MADDRAFVGEVDPDAGARLWYLDGTGVRRPVEHVAGRSADGLAWGYAGNGPADAAVSILTVATGNGETAERLHDGFMREVLAKLPLNERFALPVATVEGWLRDHGIERPAGIERQRPTADDGAAGQAEDLDGRAAALVARARALEERERRLLQREMRVDAMAVTVGVMPEVEQVTWLPAEPVRRQLEALMVDTGDDIAELAHTNGLDVRWAAAVAAGSITNVDLPHVRHVCEALHCTPYDLWGTGGARSVSHAYGPDAWPAHTEPLLPVDGADAVFVVPSADWTGSSAAPALPPPAPPGPELVRDFGPELVP